MQVRDIIANLQAYGINAERKTIYDDIEALRLFGLNILNRRGKVSGYYLEERNFEFAELKISHRHGSVFSLYSGQTCTELNP